MMAPKLELEMNRKSQRRSSKLRFSLACASLALSVINVAGCSSQPIIPEAKNIKLSRENPDNDCVEIGRVEGTVTTNRGTIEQAIEDMKLDAARKGANYVRMEATGSMGTSASGTAYKCP